MGETNFRISHILSLLFLEIRISLSENPDDSGTMDRLPLELTSEILKYLDRTAIKALRLVCKSLASEAAPVLFRNTSIFIQEHSLDILLQISKQPHLRQYVKTLRIGLELLPVDEENGWLGWDHVVDGEVCCGWDNKNSIHINSFIKAQKGLELTGRGIKMLTEAFLNLPALKSVTIGFPDHPDGSNPKSHGFEQLGLHYETRPPTLRSGTRSSCRLTRRCSSRSSLPPTTSISSPSLTLAARPSQT